MKKPSETIRERADKIFSEAPTNMSITNFPFEMDQVIWESHSLLEAVLEHLDTQANKECKCKGL